MNRFSGVCGELLILGKSVIRHTHAQDVKSAARTRALAKANDRAIWRKQQDLEVPGFVTLKGALAMLGGNVTLFALRARVTRGIAAGTISVAKHNGGKVYLPLAVIEEWRLH